MPAKKAFDATFATLRDILKPHGKRLLVTDDKPNLYTLCLRDATDRAGRPMFFGCVRAGKAYVSCHLMGVYASPDLLKGLSPALRKRMQGKSCFNFTTIDPASVKELAALTKICVARFNKKLIDKLLSC